MRPVACPIVFGSADDEEAFAKEVHFARLAQCSRYAVAPRCRVTTPRGRVLEAGDAVELRDLAGAVDSLGREVQPMARMMALVRTGLVLEREDLADFASDGPEAA